MKGISNKCGLIAAKLVSVVIALIMVMTAVLPMLTPAEEQTEETEVYTTRAELIQAIRQLRKGRGEGMEYVEFDSIYYKNLYVSEGLLAELNAESESDGYDYELYSDVIALGTDQTECENNEGDYLIHENGGDIYFYSGAFGYTNTTNITDENKNTYYAQKFNYKVYENPNSMYRWDKEAYCVEVDGVTYYPCVIVFGAVFYDSFQKWTVFSTTKAQEDQLDTDLYNLCHTGELSQYLNSDAYTKIKAVQDYVEGHVTYSTLGETDIYYLTAVSAFYEGLADCKGYALLMYRLMREMGIPVRIVDTGYHVWNIVYIDGAWYSCDASAESGKLLKGTSSVSLSDVVNPSGDEFQTNIGSKLSTTDYIVSTVSMYRLYNPNSGEHFYTAEAGERDNLVSLGWKYEGKGWTAPSYSSTPVYRLYNENGGEHHYTTNASEKDMLVSLGWNYEGIGWYSDDSKGVPVYRQYNPNAFANNHNYTTSLGENDWLVSLGWKYEGIGWYGIE